MRHVLTLIATIGGLLWPGLAGAETDDPMDRLMSALRMTDVIAIMAEEGEIYAETVAEDLLGGDGGALWAREVARIYAPARMEELMRDAFGRELPGSARDAMLGFYTSALGARISELELTARAALLDPEVEAGAIAAYHAMKEAENPELDRLTRFIEANDLIESNVVGGLNSNIAFYNGLVDGEAFSFEITEAQILSDVWGQEPDIRSETIEWLYAYLALAYHPLSDADLDSYIQVSETPAGRAFNRALFAAFDDLFDDLSYQLGRAAGQVLSGEDI